MTSRYLVVFPTEPPKEPRWFEAKELSPVLAAGGSTIRTTIGGRFCFLHIEAGFFDEALDAHIRILGVRNVLELGANRMDGYGRFSRTHPWGVTAEQFDADPKWIEIPNPFHTKM